MRVRKGQNSVGATAKVPKHRRQLDELATLRARSAKLDEALAQQTATAAILQVIKDSPTDLGRVFQAIANSSARLCNALNSSVYRFDGELIHFRAQSNFSPAAIELTKQLFPARPSRDNATARAVADRAIVHIPDVFADPDYLSQEWANAIGLRSVLSVPMIREGRPIGVITVNRAEAEPLPQGQIELLKTSADQAVIAIENARLINEVREALEKQTAMSEILRVISSSPTDVQPTFDAIAASAVRICGAVNGGIFRFDGSLIHFAAHHGWTPEELEGVARYFPLPPGRQSVTGRAILTREVAHVPDISADPEFALTAIAQSGIRATLSVPMLKDGTPLGAITVTRYAAEPFTEAQIDLLKTFADQAVIAVETVRLFTELSQRTRDLQESLEYQTATSDVLKVISRSTFDLQPVLDTLVRTAVRLCQADLASINSRDGDVYRVVASFDYSPELSAYARHFPMPPGRGTITGRTALERQVVHVADVTADPEYAAPGLVTIGNVRTALGVPLLREGEPIGVIFLARRRVEPFTERQIELVRTFADQAVIAIENQRLLTDLRQRTRDLQESLEYQRATSDVLTVISRSTFDLQPVLNALIQTAARLCEAGNGHVSIRDGDIYRSVASYAFSPEYDAALRNRVFTVDRRTIAGRTALERQVVHVADIAQDPDYAMPETVTIGNVRTALGVPLLREGEPIGVIALGRSRVAPFTERQIELVRTFADQAVIAIENMRLLTELRESLDRQTATAEVLSVVNSSQGDLQPVFDVILEKAHSLCGVACGSLHLYDDETVHAVATDGLSEDFDGMLRRGFCSADSFTTRRLIEGAPFVQIRDMAELDNPVNRAAFELSGIRTALFVPLRKDNTVLGVIIAARQEVQPFSDHQIALLQSFAAQAVIAMENARLLGELRDRTADLARSVDELTATSDVLKIISRSSVDLETVLDTLVQTVMPLCRADHALMFRRRDDMYHLVAARGLSQEAKDFFLVHPFAPSRQTATGRVALEGRAVHITDVLQDPEFTYKAVEFTGARTLLGIPLLREAALVGIFVAARTRVDPFTTNEIALATTFADQAVIAIENARLFDELRERQAELRVTFENMGDGVVMFNAAARLTAWNRNFQEMLGLPDAFLAQRPSYADYFRYLAERGEYSADLEAELSRHIEDIRREMRLERTRPDGRVIEVRRNPVPGGGFVLIYSDVTERKHAEQAIRAARDAAETALRDLQTAQASLLHSQKMAALGQLTAGIAHEIKNPLNFVNNFASLSNELLAELKDIAVPVIDKLDDERRVELEEVVVMLSGNLDKIAEHGRRADGIVRSMLAHSRGATGDRQAADLNALVEEALNLAYHGARAQDQNFNITMERQFDPAMKPIELVPQDITRVFLNLFGNGFYAVNKRGRARSDGFRPVLRVATHDTGDGVEIRVRDNGNGIPSEIRDKLFQPFFTTKPTGEGTGLGLSISYEIVTEQHGGTITVDSEPGVFTEFTVRLPRRLPASQPRH